MFPDAGTTKHLQQFSKVSDEIDGGESSDEDASTRCCAAAKWAPTFPMFLSQASSPHAHTQLVLIASVAAAAHQVKRVHVFLSSAGMVGYGMAKAAVHQLCQSLAAKNSGMPSGAAAVAILPWVPAITPDEG